ncbi:aspartate aminotransferase family protein [bacterium CPR1]|nr:aspartate aminotransferase family protein [bacterium CPR1]
MNRSHLMTLLLQEEKRFRQDHPRSLELYERACRHLPGGVPMHWMVRWAGSFPVFVEHGKGAHFTCVDGHEYLDLCLGDTGAMTGHSPEATVRAVAEQAERGFTFMLPNENALWLAEELSRRFGLPYWQFSLSATDANRFAIRLARHLTGRPKILVFNGCYHGSVDETFISLSDQGAVSRSGNIGPPVDPVLTSRVVEFNDLPALEQALAHRDVACVLAEPVMTNVGIIHPDPGYHEVLRRLTREHGSLLILDETHTICAGPGGYTGEHGLEPDMLTLGKPIGGGVPVGVYGFTAELAERMQSGIARDECDTGGIGGTLAGNALSLAAARATLEQVLTRELYQRTIPLAESFAAGIQTVIDHHNLGWIVKQLGCRVEYWFRPTPPRNGGEALAAVDADLDRFMHLFALNRGILMTPFHNMALIAPNTRQADIDRHTQVFRQAVEALLAVAPA